MMLVNPFMFGATPSTVALYHFNSDFSDSSPFSNSTTIIGTPTIDTIVTKFGGGSASFVAAGSISDPRVLIPATANLKVGNLQPFTVEFWFYGNPSEPYGSGMVTMRDDSVYCPFVIRPQSVYIGNADLLSWTFSPAFSGTSGVWNHFALVADGTNLKLYLNGVSFFTTTHPNWADDNQKLSIGADLYGFTGLIDELRFKKEAVYTANFTPPNMQFPNS
mgnify:CR=1 FL=1|jgi:hypothetical protein